MTSNNPFADRIAQAAKEGYVNRTPSFAAPAALACSAKQFELIISLLNEKDLAAETRPKFLARTAWLAENYFGILEMNRQEASNLITYLFGLPAVSGTVHAPAAFAEVSAGHYAVEQDGGIVFLQVDRPTEGRWAGKVFVKLQHGDDYTNMGRDAGNTMLGRIIEQGVKECSIRYGRELGRCGVCHRTLTNEESRTAGIGPVCAQKSGW